MSSFCSKITIFALMELVFATNNENKLKEVQNLVGNKIVIKSLKDIGFEGEIPETQDSLYGNAIQKARFIADKYKVNCFADDTGLEIDALNGEPGVYSARFAGPECVAENNIKKVLDKMRNTENRSAQFRTFVALVLNNEVYTVEGKVEGKITKEPKGLYGFGYDPIFEPENQGVTFAEMWLEQKNQMSHRARAINKFVDLLKTLS